METEKIYTQHDENKEWTSNLLFFNDEIRIMEHRLEEIVSKNTSKEVLKQVEHFQNQLIIQKDQIIRINHEINLNNDTICAEIKKNNTAVDHRKIGYHNVIRDNVESFEKIFSSLKTELNAFLSKWM